MIFGTSSQFLKADGSLDSSAYITLTAISASTPLSYNNLTGLGFSDFYGEYSWGKIELSERFTSNEYFSYRNNGIIGLSTSGVVIRTEPLRYFEIGRAHV